MADVFTRKKRSVIMSHIRSKNTKPEIAVRRLIREMGYSYRLHGKSLPGRPDLVLARYRRVVFVHGCFWHVHGGRCKRARPPRSRIDYWTPKLEANKQRDRLAAGRLRRSGWRVLIIWECQLRHAEKLRRRIQRFMED